MTSTYIYVYETDTAAAGPAIWALYEDVNTWPQWDAGSETVTRDGEFAAGATGTMKLIDQADPLRYRVTEVLPGTQFIDETVVGPMTVRFMHRLTPLTGGQVRIAHRVEIDGPAEQTAQVGPAITAGIPATVAALTALAIERS